MKKYISLLSIILSFQLVFGQKEELKKELDTLKNYSKTITTTDNSTNNDDYLAKPFNVTTPEVSQLIKSELIPINHATGKVEYSIPIFEVKEGSISVPITLKYASNGIRVNQESTNVGLDWVLMAGGSVTKFVNDIDDHKFRVNQNESNYTDSYWDDYYQSWIYLYTPSDDWGQYVSKRGRLVTDNEIEYMPDSKVTPATSKYEQYLDLAADTFFAVAPGLHSEFYLNKKTAQDGDWDPRFSTFSYRGHELDGIGNKIYVNKYDKFDISSVPNNAWMGSNTVFPSQCTSPLGNLDNYVSQNNFSVLKNNAKDYDQFQIVNAYGNIYSFTTNDINTSSSIEEPFSFYDSSPEASKSRRSICKLILENNYNIDINTWNLDYILDITTNNRINFKYKKNIQSRNKLTDFDRTKVIEDSYIVNYPNGNGNYYPGGGVLPVNYTTSKYSQNSVYNYIEEIKWSEGKVKFFYDFSRSDSFDDNNNLTPKKALSQIVVYDLNGHIIKKVKLNYGYFRNTQVTSDLDVRLRLDDVAFYDKNDTFLYNYKLQYNTTILPSKGTSENTKNYRDLFGYFKQYSSGEFPKTYYQIIDQKFKFENLSFANSTFLHGNLDMSPDSNTGTGMLSKVTTPTGGYHEFTYEPNKFFWNGQEQTGGGVRLKEQKISDGSNIERTIKYIYVASNGVTSGRTGNIPSMVSNRAGNWYNFQGQSGSGPYPAISFSQQNMTETDDNSYVIYEKVIEEETGKGRTVFTFTGYSEYPNTYPHTEDHTSGSWFSNLTPIHSYYKNRSRLRGKLLSKEVYAEGSNYPLQTENYEYKLGRDISTNHNILYYSTYQFKPAWDVIIDNTPENLLLYKQINRNNYTDINNYLEKQIIHEYYNASPILNNGVPISYNYLNTTFLQKKDQLIQSDGSIIETSYNYPSDQSIQYLTDLNLIGALQQKISIKKKNEADQGKIISKVNKNFPLNQAEAFNKTNGFPVPYSAFSVDLLNGQLSTELTYEKYDNKGNLQQFSDASGRPTSIIWGYHQTKPIAKIEGAKFSDIDSQLISSIVDSSNSDETAAPNSDESAILNMLDTFRNHPSLAPFQITTYTYDPLVGVRSITTPTGIRENFLYDDAYRLQKVTDQTGKAVKEHQYGYIPSIYYSNTLKSQAFTKNNCTSGATPVPITYTVIAGKYSSYISQAVADQTASDDIAVNGQSYANANGLCNSTTYCSLSFNSSLGISGGGSASVSPGAMYKINIGFTSGSNSMNLPWTTTGVKVADIVGNCRPVADYSSYNGQVYYTIKTNGEIIIRKHLGTTTPNNTSHNYELFFPIN